jgi:hypothetical protein
VNAPITAVADAFTYQDVELAALDDHRTRAVLRLDTWEWLLASLAFLDTGFTVHEPHHFRTALQAFGARLLDAQNGQNAR